MSRSKKLKKVRDIPNDRESLILLDLIRLIEKDLNKDFEDFFEMDILMDLRFHLVDCLISEYRNRDYTLPLESFYKKPHEKKNVVAKRKYPKGIKI